MDNRPIVIHAGDAFACDNGHTYAVAKINIYASERTRPKDFTFAIEQGSVKVPGPVKCNVCGGYVWSVEKHFFGREKLGETYFDMTTNP